MLNTYLLKNIVEGVESYLFNRIELNPIPIIIGETFYKNALAEYHSIGKYIILNPDEWEEEDKKYYDNLLNYRFENDYQRLIFALCHELGHYIQHIKFPKWFEKEKFKYNFYSPYFKFEYTKQLPIERIADKIGLILFKDVKQKVNEVGLTFCGNVVYS